MGGRRAACSAARLPAGPAARSPATCAAKQAPQQSRRWRHRLAAVTPAALTQLKPGEVVLGLGSGGGIDVLLSARRAGPSGQAYRLDMTGEMRTLAEENKARSGLANVESLRARARTSRFQTPRWRSSPTAAAAGTPERTHTDAR